MAVASSAASGVRYEPTSRWGPLSTVSNNHVYMWGGYSKGFTSKNKNQEAEAKIEIFDPIKEQWRQTTTRGSVPPKVNEGACASSSTHLYTYGGNSGFSDSGCLHQLDIATLTWKEICPHKSGGPMKKIGGGMIVFDNKVALFGGHGIPSKAIQPGSQFAKNDLFTDGHGKTNELHVFDLKKEIWSSPKVTGDRPPPCVAFAFTLIAPTRALLFGGNMHELGRTNNVYSIDLKTMHCTRHPHPKGQAAPAGREGHAAVCLNFGSLTPKLLITGGVDVHSKVLGDMWMLDTRTWSWKEMKSASNQPRFDHCMEAIPICPSVTEVMMFGGCPQWPRNFKSYDDFPHVAETTLVRFESRDWILTGAVDYKQFGNDHRVKEKSNLVANAPSQVPVDVQVPLPIITNLEYAEKKAREAVEKLEDAERTIVEMEMKVEEENEKRSEAEQKLEQEVERVLELERRAVSEKRQLQSALESTRHSKEELQKLLKAKEDQMVEMQREKARIEEASQLRIQQGEDQARELQARLTQMEEQWLVSKSEITILDENLGGGGWGEVKVATFRGVRVAAKSLYQSIRSDYYRQLFVREMNMASRVRHPNLVQFIGACLDDDMLILMELLPTSLRKELEKPGFHLPEKTLRSITLDIVRALNYLHLMQPDPIIHRDISSANVLLEPVAGEGWRAKVTDYGSVNFQKQTKTVGPGNISYAGPESHGATGQSTKMDIFSFGVLVLEMCTGHFPDETKRKMEIASLRDLHWKNLINKCICEGPEKRPTASRLIAEITSMTK